MPSSTGLHMQLGPGTVWPSQLRAASRTATRVIELSELAYGESIRLGKPVVRSDNFCVVGTEIDTPPDVAAAGSASRPGNSLLAAMLDVSDDSSAGATDYWRIDVAGEVRDIAWAGTSTLIIALDSTLGLLRLSGEESTVVDCPGGEPTHTDTIRELAVHPEKEELVLSGGFDFTARVTDVSRLAAGRAGASVASWEATNVIGSVRWLPTHGSLCSWTLDDGSLDLFDLRTGRVVQQWGVDPGSFAHEWLNDSCVIIGRGDGCLRVFDIRALSITDQPAAAKVPGVAQIGELCLSADKSKIACFGVPGFAVVDVGDLDPSSPFGIACPLTAYGTLGSVSASEARSIAVPKQDDPDLDALDWLGAGADSSVDGDGHLPYKVAGSFFPHMADTIVVADSEGRLGWFEL